MEFLSPPALRPQSEEQASLCIRGWCLLSGCHLFTPGVPGCWALVPQGLSRLGGLMRGWGSSGFAAQAPGCNQAWNQGVFPGAGRSQWDSQPRPCVVYPLPVKGCPGNYQIPPVVPGPLQPRGHFLCFLWP